MVAQREEQFYEAANGSLVSDMAVATLGALGPGLAEACRLWRVFPSLPSSFLPCACAAPPDASSSHTAPPRLVPLCLAGPASLSQCEEWNANGQSDEWKVNTLRRLDEILDLKSKEKVMMR